MQRKRGGSAQMGRCIQQVSAWLAVGMPARFSCHAQYNTSARQHAIQCLIRHLDTMVCIWAMGMCSTHTGTLVYNVYLLPTPLRISRTSRAHVHQSPPADPASAMTACVPAKAYGSGSVAWLIMCQIAYYSSMLIRSAVVLCISLYLVIHPAPPSP